MGKLCNSCGNTKSISEFGKRTASKDGLSPKCKLCASHYDKKRANLPHRVKARNSYQMTKSYTDSHNKAAEKYRRKYPLKYKAHNMANNAIRDGKLFREPCEVCESTDNIHAHHDDYLKPLNIRWLCASCHSKWHSINGEAKNAS